MGLALPRAVVVGLLLLLAPRAAGAQLPPVAVAPDARTQQLWDGLVDPCLGARNALVRQGRDPADTSDPVVAVALETAWASTLPVLVEIGVDPGLALQPDALAALVDGELGHPRTYASAEEVLAFLDAVAERGRLAVARDTATRPGQLLLAVIWGDPDRRDAWQFTARYGHLRSAEREAALRAWEARSGGAGAALTRCQ